MITYASGATAMLGDVIDYDGYPGVIEAVVDCDEEFRTWGLKQRGLMLNTKAFGLVFVPESHLGFDLVRLVSRAVNPES